MTHSNSPHDAPTYALQDDLTYALQNALRMSRYSGVPMNDTLWVIASLKSADAYSIAESWWDVLGIQQCRKKGRILFQIQQNKSPETFKWHEQFFKRIFYGLQRLFFNTLFMDMPEERRLLLGYMNESPLFQLAMRKAKSNESPKIEWVHWLAALDDLHPEWREMWNLPKASFSEAGLLAKQEALNQNRFKRLSLYWTKEVVQFILVFSLLLIGVRQGLAEPRLIPSGSMEPTIQVKDRVIVEKPSTWLHHPYKRGEILVFVPPDVEVRNDPLSIYLRLTGLSGYLTPVNNVLAAVGIENVLPSVDTVDMAYIKRLIALPGDMINVVPHVGVFINGVLLEEPYVAEVANASCTLHDAQGNYCQPFIVPEGHVFMMGDNRNNSHDSRYWGFLPMNRILGRAVFRFWPLGRIEPIGDEYPKSNEARIDDYRPID